MDINIEDSILKLTSQEVKAFFLDEKKYFTTILPPYFTFNDLLKSLSDHYDTCHKNNNWDSVCDEAGKFDDVNYKLITNKDGYYAWRKIEIIHPFLYICLVNLLCNNWEKLKKRFVKFNAIRREKITSPCIPLENIKSKKKEQKYTKITILNWWKNVEQESIILSLKYSYVINVDIRNCYSSFYTHSVGWAIHGKERVKEYTLKNKERVRKNKSKNIDDFWGERVDKILRSMSYQQTNGIPQGSVLMDFVAEIILGYIDVNLVVKLRHKVKDYKIIRYRDDYKIFANSLVDGEEIVRCLSEVLIEFGMSLNHQKTSFETSVVNGSLKKDKLHLILYEKNQKNLQKQLLMIYNFGRQYSNSGQLVRLISEYNKKHLKKLPSISEREVLASIIVNIAYENPRVYPICISIISKLLSNLEKKDIERIIEQIRHKFSNKINNDYLDIWMQRLSYKQNSNIRYNCKLCKLITEEENILWNSSWLSDEKIKQIIEKTSLINRTKLKAMPPIITQDEVDDFFYKYY